MTRDLHRSPHLAPVAEYEPRDPIVFERAIAKHRPSASACYEYATDDTRGLCLTDEALLEMLARHKGEDVLVRRTR